ncbi:ubiquitin-conjugating enzyme/RWD-like protein [Scleroderma yunnanense]
MSSDSVLAEEFEVLESIYPTEISVISDREIEIDVEPDYHVEGTEPFKLKLSVQYPYDYPNALPTLALRAIEGEIDDTEKENLLQGIAALGEENTGMAMTFTLVSHLREQLTILVEGRIAHQIAADREKERLAIEAEEARTQGTPVTVDSFKVWKVKFDKEILAKKAGDEEEKLRAMTPKEKEEYKKIGTRLTGRQLFERNRNLAHEDDGLMEEGTVSVDISQYDRIRVDAEVEEDHVHFSDSD